jgi:hypothetical protein
MSLNTPKANSGVARRNAHRQWVLKPQDLVVALKLHVLGEDIPSYAHLGRSLHLSQFEAHAAVQRLIAARLATQIDNRIRPVVASLKNFLINGAVYAYPPVRGELTIGIPTAQAAAPLNELMVGSAELPPVWPDPQGDVRGQSLLPLYPGVPGAAQNDSKLYALLALFNALRVGQARERNLAVRFFDERLT